MTSAKPHAMGRVTGPADLSWGRFCRSLLLPLLLLLAQQGAQLHGLSHYIEPETRDADDQHQPDVHHCDVCLAFAQIASTATAPIAVPELLTGLSFALAVPTHSRLVVTEPPAQRNRGPPPVL